MKRILPVLFVWVAIAGVLAGQTTDSSDQKSALPKVVLVGDSIRLGYASRVAKLLDGKAIVVSAMANGEDSGNVLENLEEWVIREQPDVVHLNAGLHDLKRTGAAYQVPLPQYEKNLNEILHRIQQGTHAKIIFATSTPIIDRLHAARRAGFDRFEADVEKYNSAAVAVMKGAGIPVNDLHKLVEDQGREKLMAGDGTHYTDAGYDVLAAAVVNSITHSLPQQR